MLFDWGKSTSFMAAVQKSKLTTFGRALYWTCLAFIWGLLQLWIDVAVTWFQNPTSVTAFGLIKDGVVLFFVMGLTAGITVDYHLNDIKEASGGVVKSAIFVFIPMIVTVMVVLGYLAGKQLLDARQTSLFISLNIASVILSAAYALTAKIYLMYKA